MATSPLLLAAGGAAVGVAAGGPVGAAIGAAAGLLLGFATGGESTSSSPLTSSPGLGGGGSRLLELIDPNGDKYALPNRAIDWLYGGEIDIQPPLNARGWGFWTKAFPSGRVGSPKVLRAYRLARGCSPTNDRYAVWSRFAIQHADAKADLDGIDQSKRQEAFDTLIGIGLRGSDLSDLSEQESFWTAQRPDLAAVLYFIGLQRLPVTLRAFGSALTPGLLAALIQVAGERAEDCDILPGRGMSCEGDLDVDTTDYLCKGLPGAACSLDGKSGAFDRLGLCVIPEAPPAPALYQGTESYTTTVTTKDGQQVQQTVYSCKPGYELAADGVNCVSTAKVCPEGQFLNALGNCVSPQPQTTVNESGQIQVNQPTLSQVSAGQVGAAIGASATPTFPAVSPTPAPAPVPSLANLYNFNVPTVTPISQVTPIAQFKPLSAAPITRLANMGIGLPRRRG